MEELVVNLSQAAINAFQTMRRARNASFEFVGEGTGIGELCAKGIAERDPSASVERPCIYRLTNAGRGIVTIVIG